jgi:hypothetical protein
MQPPQGRPPAGRGEHAPRKQPHAPPAELFFTLSTPTIPASWETYLSYLR